MSKNPAWSHNNPLDYSRLVELLTYDPMIGEFRWNVDRTSYRGKAKAGSLAGAIDSKGYRYIGIDGGAVQAHVLAWFWVHKQWPSIQIDHINMVPDDNRISNLREATMSQQRANQKVRVDSATGVKGVQRTPAGQYLARIYKDGIRYYLGIHPTVDAASAAYEKAAVELFCEFARVV